MVLEEKVGDPMEYVSQMPEHVQKYFDYYYALGPKRSINKVHKDIGGVSYPTLLRWSNKYNWDARISRELNNIVTPDGEVVQQVDSKSLNRQTLKTIDNIIKSIQKRPEKTEKDAASLYKLIDLRAKIAEKIDEVEEKDRLKSARDFVEKMVVQLEEELEEINVVKA